MPDLQGDGTFLEKAPVNASSGYELHERGISLSCLHGRAGGRTDLVFCRSTERPANDPVFCGGEAEQVLWVVCSHG